MRSSQAGPSCRRRQVDEPRQDLRQDHAEGDLPEKCRPASRAFTCLPARQLQYLERQVADQDTSGDTDDG